MYFYYNIEKAVNQWANRGLNMNKNNMTEKY